MSFADLELQRQGVRLEPLLQAICDFLDKQPALIERVRRVSTSVRNSSKTIGLKLVAGVGLSVRLANGFRRRSVGGKRVGRQSLFKTAAARGGGRRPVFTRDCLPTNLGHRERRSQAFRHGHDQATTPPHANLAWQ